MVQQQKNDNPWGDLPPESTEFGFPLYLNLTVYDANTDEWWREEDDVSSALYQWCEENLVGDDTDSYVPLSDDTKIYINGGLVDEIIKNMGTYYLSGASLPFYEVAFTGSLYGFGAKFPIQTTLQFPLYIYFDECEQIRVNTTCYAYGDFSELRRYLIECAERYGTKVDDYRYMDEAAISQIGEIYIEDERLNILIYDYGTDEVNYHTATYVGFILANKIVGDK